jgi:hypothetical protein
MRGLAIGEWEAYPDGWQRAVNSTSWILRVEEQTTVTKCDYRRRIHALEDCQERALLGNE